MKGFMKLKTSTDNTVKPEDILMSTAFCPGYYMTRPPDIEMNKMLFHKVK